MELDKRTGKRVKIHTSVTKAASLSQNTHPEPKGFFSFSMHPVELMDLTDVALKYFKDVLQK